MTIVFLDANVLAKPVTRTVLMVGGVPSGFKPVWSLAAEIEATAHMRPRAISPALVREHLGLMLTPSGDRPERFAGTKGADQQILADAAAARARFLVTEDVDDDAQADLTSVGISAVNPDVFLAERLTRDAYATVIALFVERQVNPPTTPAGFHAAIARQHPRLFAARRPVRHRTRTQCPRRARRDLPRHTMPALRDDLRRSRHTHRGALPGMPLS